MKVINRNIGTSMLSHYCPNCGREVFNDHSVHFDPERNCGIGKCPNCSNELEFPNTVALIKLLGL